MWTAARRNAITESWLNLPTSGWWQRRSGFAQLRWTKSISRLSWKHYAELLELAQDCTYFCVRCLESDGGTAYILAVNTVFINQVIIIYWVSQPYITWRTKSELGDLTGNSSLSCFSPIQLLSLDIAYLLLRSWSWHGIASMAPRWEWRRYADVQWSFQCCVLPFLRSYCDGLLSRCIRRMRYPILWRNDISTAQTTNVPWTSLLLHIPQPLHQRSGSSAVHHCDVHNGYVQPWLSQHRLSSNAYEYRKATKALLAACAFAGLRSIKIKP